MQSTETVDGLEAQLNDPDLPVRMAALNELAAQALPRAPEADVANMHCHTFFSFNAYGHSPASLAWLARQRGFRLLGIVDFDVLDGVEEYLTACDLVGVRGSAGIETRIYVSEYATREINSPGEPGIAYHMGIGFTTSTAPAAVAPILQSLRERAARRNREMVRRINRHLDPLTVDYEGDVLPLTPAGRAPLGYGRARTPVGLGRARALGAQAPAGNATERHILVAYMQVAAARQADLAGFWAGKLGAPRAEVEALLADPVAFQNLVRARLMKRGGVGYVEPTPEAFPTAGDFHRLITACGALPCLAWLDGTSAGEAEAEALVAFWVARGAAALNIIPDRNWSIADPGLRRVKLARLYEIVRLAQGYDLPLNVGTEMNAPGQKLVDDFDAPELAPVRGAFLDGAHFVYGHTALQRALGLGHGSPWAAAQLPSRHERNAFYTEVGRLLPPGRVGLARLAGLGAAPEPGEVLAQLRK